MTGDATIIGGPGNDDIPVGVLGEGGGTNLIINGGPGNKDASALGSATTTSCEQ